MIYFGVYIDREGSVVLWRFGELKFCNFIICNLVWCFCFFKNSVGYSVVYWFYDLVGYNFWFENILEMGWVGVFSEGIGRMWEVLLVSVLWCVYGVYGEVGYWSGVEMIIGGKISEFWGLCIWILKFYEVMWRVWGKSESSVGSGLCFWCMMLVLMVFVLRNLRYWLIDWSLFFFFCCSEYIVFCLF